MPNVRTIVPRRLTAAALAAAMIACGGQDRGPGDQGGSVDPSVLQHGYGPEARSPARFQPDVRIVGGGAAAIRSVSEDGLTWIIDGSAAGVRELARGHVMFATSRAVGRVLDVRPAGSDVAVTLAPVSITEVIRDGHLLVDREISSGGAFHRALPPFPGTESPLAPLAAAFRAGYGTPTFRLASAPSSKQTFEEARRHSFKLKVNEWEIEPYLKYSDTQTLDAPPEWQMPRAVPHGTVTQGTQVGLKAYYNVHSSSSKAGPVRASRGLKFGADVSLFGETIRTHVSLPISNGEVDRSASFVIEGIEVVDIGIFGGSENGSGDNVSVRIEVPMEITEQFPPAPPLYVPTTFQAKFKFIISTAFTAKNSTLAARGRYRLKGPIGYQNGEVKLPTFEVVQPMMESMSGLSVGVTGLVFAWETRMLVGIGTPAAMGGPYTKVVVSTGLSQGSALAGGLGVCRGTTLKIDAGGGVGLQMSHSVVEGLAQLLARNGISREKPVKAEVDLVEVMGTIVKGTSVSPQIPLCTGS